VIPVVWLVGASGVGKTTVGWALQQRLARRGVTAAFVDADQLRNAAGADAGEPVFIAAGLRAVEPAFRAGGATAIVVSGIVDDEAMLRRMLPGYTREDVLVVHLRASGGALTDRIERRRWNVHLAAESVEYAARFDDRWADIRLETTGVSIDDLVAALVEPTERHLRTRPATPVPFVPSTAIAAPRTTIITGAGGAGLSTAGFLAFLQLAGAGEAVGYIDSHQVGFVGLTPRSRELAPLRAVNAAAVAREMADLGLPRVLITADPPTANELTSRLDGATVIWLDASPATLESRLRTRADGGGPPLAGDHRLGLDETELRESLEVAIAESHDIAARPDGCHLITTDDATADEVAQRITRVAPR